MDEAALRRALRHDLRNPLAVILGRCELLSTGANGPINDAQKNSVAAIARAAARMQELIDRMADSREGGGPPLDAPPKTTG